MDGVAITDHNTVKGGLKAMKFAREKYPNFKVIPGCEIKSEGLHILALGISSWKNVKNLSRIETVEKIDEFGGVSVIAHPFRKFRKFWREGFNEPIRFNAIETLNGGESRVSNLKAWMFAKRMKLPGIAGSDAHLREYVGCVYTICNGEVLEDIRKGRVDVGGNILSLSSLTLEKIKRFGICLLSAHKIMIPK